MSLVKKKKSVADKSDGNMQCTISVRKRIFRTGRVGSLRKGCDLLKRYIGLD